MHDGIEESLRQSLGRVSAPNELWSRVQGGKPVAEPRFQTAWAVAAFAALLVTSVTGWSMLRVASPQELHSASSTEVREWVLEHSGLDVPLPAKPSSLVEIVGASIDKAVATISYKVGALQASLVVSKDPAGAKAHTTAPIASASPYTWAMNGQSYTLTVPAGADLRTACVLCHNPHGTELY